MARKRKNNARGILVLIFIILFLVNWLYDKLGIPTGLTYTLLISVAIAALLAHFAEQNHKFIAALLAHFAEQNHKFRAIQIANIDSMTGIVFERYLQKLLSTQGYSVSTTQASGDLGVDLVASRSGEKIAIQVKRSKTKISRRAISDAVAGMQHYRCNKAMVITNNYFTPGAVTLARSTGCVLVDRDMLAKWIVEFQNASNSYRS
jgi:HJR/Mrr/RecB family endonuclease